MPLLRSSGGDLPIGEVPRLLWRTVCPSGGCVQPGDGVYGGVQRGGRQSRRRGGRRDAEHGRNQYAWQELRTARRQLDGHRCVYCGSTEDLTVDVDPGLTSNHRIATIDDCRTACRSCNSSLGSY